MVTSFIVQRFVSDITSGGGINGAPATVGGPDSWGPAMHVAGPITPSGLGDGPMGTSPGIGGTPGTGGPLAWSVPPSVLVPSPASSAIGGVSFGQSLLFQGLGVAAANYLSGSWRGPSSQGEIRASSYLLRAADTAPKPVPPKQLPTLDSTGRVHGEHGRWLPQPQDFRNYDIGELERLLEDLRESVQNRRQNIDDLGYDEGHGQRLRDEQRTMRDLERYLDRPQFRRPPFVPFRVPGPVIIVPPCAISALCPPGGGT
jgi:hypothetical protein